MAKNQQEQAVKAWDFYPVRDKRVERLWVLGGLGLFGGTVVLAVGLPGAAVLALFGGIFAAPPLLYSDEKGAQARAGLEARGSWRPVDKGYLARAFHDMARAYGVEDKARFYLASKDYAEKANQPRLSLVAQLVRGLLLLLRVKKPVKAAAAEDTRYFNLTGSFLAYTGMSAVLTTAGEMRKYTQDTKKLILAHELSHLKTRDGKRMEIFARPFVREIRALFVLGLCLPPPLYGSWAFSGPLAGALSPLSLMLLCTAAALAGTACLNAASRVCERRADRNAMYMTRDMKGAEDMVRVFSGKNFDKKPFIVDTWCATHPQAGDRLANLRKAFETASAYPPPAHRYVHTDAPSKFARGHKPGVVPWGQNAAPPAP